MKKLPQFTDFTPGIFAKTLKVQKPLPAGLSYSSMNEQQKQALWQIIENYHAQFAPEIAQEALAEVVRDGLENIEFIYAGDPQMQKIFYL